MSPCCLSPLDFYSKSSINLKHTKPSQIMGVTGKNKQTKAKSVEEDVSDEAVVVVGGKIPLSAWLVFGIFATLTAALPLCKCLFE